MAKEEEAVAEDVVVVEAGGDGEMPGVRGPVVVGDVEEDL